MKNNSSNHTRQKPLKDLITLNETFADAARQHYSSIGLTHVEVPSIVGITGACENVDTLFRVGSRLHILLFFSQTGQLSLEQALQHFPGVYTVIHSGRDEEEEDARHLRQFRLTEEEFDWSMVDEKAGDHDSAHADAGSYDEEKMYEALLQHIEAATKNIARAIAVEHPDILATYKRDATRLIESLALPYHRITYEDVLGLLRYNGFPELAWGDDLKAEHEAKVVELLNGTPNDSEFPRPVFIMRYPQEIKFFNMKVSERDPRVVLSADLVFPYAGEGVGSAVREHDGGKLTKRLLGSTMFRLHKERGGTLDDFKWYLDLVQSGTTRPHAGYGIGNERLLQYVLGQPDIRPCSTFHLMARQTADWASRELAV
jgi:asparaginyl-tRNA synthetase